MKKQILFVAMFTLAIIFAGTNNVFGQLNPSPFTPASVPNPLVNCVGDAQHPKAGVSYNYLLNNTSADATGYRFWATKDPDFVSLVAGTTTLNQADSLHRNYSTELFGYSASYLGQTVTNSVDITWGPDLLARTDYQQGHIGAGTIAAPTSTFVVGWAENCADNIKIWEIDPSPAFTVDIKVIDDATRLPLGYGVNTGSQCVDDVRAAKYNTTDFQIDYNYGWDTLYYEVIASNFVTSWLPTFYLTGLDGTIQTARIDWATSWDNIQKAAGPFIEGGDITGGSITGTTAITSVNPNTVNGVSLFVRVVIANNNYETLAAETIELSVAGLDAVGYDIDDDALCTVPATAADAADDDETSRTITPRPTIVEGTPLIIPNGGIATP